VPCNEGGRVGVLPLSKRVCFPRVQELVRVRSGVAVEGSGAHIISRYVRVKGGCGGLAWGGSPCFGPGERNCGCTRWENRGPDGGRCLTCGCTGRGNRRPGGGRRLGRGRSHPMSQVTNGCIDRLESTLEGRPGGHGVEGSLNIVQLGCYGVQLTRHGGERVERGAGTGDEDRLAVRQAGELMIVEDGELSRGKV